jgi:hypothetical protein
MQATRQALRAAGQSVVQGSSSSVQSIPAPKCAPCLYGLGCNAAMRALMARRTVVPSACRIGSPAPARVQGLG